ncbi:MAG: tetratricopeptide repeat protein [Phycisphaerales bacterium]|nr:tetratricopeptide repeat protein [Phycisphaerales bacterium]
MIRLAVAITMVCGIAAAHAQDQDESIGMPQRPELRSPEPVEEVKQAVLDRVNAPYLTADERAELSIVHGLWTEQTLTDPMLGARAALVTGAYDDPVLMSEDASAIDRASGALERGEARLAMELLAAPSDDQPLRRLTLRARAQAMLGDTQGAITELETLETVLADRTINDATELAFGVRGLMHLYRLRAIDGNAETVYKQLNELIARGRDEIDQLNPEIRMAEAELLYEHHNRKDARDAAMEVLHLNPRHALAASMLGNIAVDSFALDDAEQIADRIDTLAAGGQENPPATMLGAQIRARAALRRRDPIGAEMALDRVLVRMPDQRALLQLEAAAAAGGFREASTNRLLDAYDLRSPGQPDALLMVGRTLAEARQYEQSAAILRRAIERSPHWGEPYMQLGLMLVQAGDDVGAKDALEKAIERDPFNLRAQNSLTLVRELMGYETIETEHFVIRYKGGIDRVLAEEMPAELERMYARVTGDLPGGVDHEPSKKTRIELMPNHEWFAVRIGGMPSIHTMAASTGPIIAMETPRDGAKSSVGPYDWARVLQHEFTHTANLSRTKNRIIHWMTEANAVYNEDSPRDERQWMLLLNAQRTGGLFDLDEINEAFVRPKRPGDRSLAYAQGAWMFEFIIERFGAHAPLEIMDASAAGRSPSEAFSEALGIDRDAFMAEFLPWAQEQLLAYGLLLSDEYPTLDEVLVNENNQRVVPNRNSIDTLLESHPDHPQLMNIKIGFLLDDGPDRLTDEWTQRIEQYAQLNPAEETPHRLLARHYLAGESRDEQWKAVEHLEYLDAREVHSSAYADELAMIYAKNGMVEKAVEKAMVAVRRAPFNAHAREQAARVALIAGDLRTAAHQIRVLTELEPDREIHTQRLEAIERRLGE